MTITAIDWLDHFFTPIGELEAPPVPAPNARLTARGTVHRATWRSVGDGEFVAWPACRHPHGSLHFHSSEATTDQVACAHCLKRIDRLQVPPAVPVALGELSLKTSLWTQIVRDVREYRTAAWKVATTAHDSCAAQRADALARAYRRLRALPAQVSTVDDFLVAVLCANEDKQIIVNVLLEALLESE